MARIKHSALCVVAMAALFVSLAQGADKPKYPSFGKIERNDPRFDKLFAKDAHMEKLAGGLIWCEGPTWIKDGGYVLFSDIPRNSRDEVERRRRAQPVHAARGLHRRRRPTAASRAATGC